MAHTVKVDARITLFQTDVEHCRLEQAERAKTDAKSKAIVERYQHRPREELYDLRNDPFEMNNLAGNPEQTNLLKLLRRQLAEWCKTQGDKLALAHLIEQGAEGKAASCTLQLGRSTRSGWDAMIA
jgi:arylsulfatase A-like enzyme